MQLFAQDGTQTQSKFGTQLGDLHAGHHQKLATQHFAGLIVVRQFGHDAAILTILIPAETSVGNGLRADVLKAAKNGVLLGNLERFAHDLDFDQALVRSKNLGTSVRRRWFRHLRSRLL
jgi:hypothetical protein